MTASRWVPVLACSTSTQIIKKIGGRLFPLGWISLLTGKRKLDRVRVISTNVLPEYQKWGLGIVTLARILPSAIERGIQIGEFSWVLGEQFAVTRDD